MISLLIILSVGKFLGATRFNRTGSVSCFLQAVRLFPVIEQISTFLYFEKVKLRMAITKTNCKIIIQRELY